MSNTGIIKKCLSAIVLVALFSACSIRTEHAVKIESNLAGPSIKGAPDWVNNGSTLLSSNDARLFHGIGHASAMGDYPMQKASADDMARAEVAHMLSIYLDTIANEYMIAAKADGADVSQESVSQQIKSISQANMAGTRIIRSWRDLKSAKIWSAAELDVLHVKNTLADISDMSADLRRYIEINADNIFDRMVRERNSIKPAIF
jgi:hypothetical protein